MLPSIKFRLEKTMTCEKRLRCRRRGTALVQSALCESCQRYKYLKGDEATVLSVSEMKNWTLVSTAPRHVIVRVFPSMC